MGIKLPRISITVSGGSGDSETSGKLSILSVGFGIHQAWIYSAMFGASSIFQSSAVIGLPDHSYFQFMPATLVFMISILAFSACLLFASFTDQKFLTFYVSKKVLIGSGVLTAIGTLATYATSAGGGLGVFAVFFAGITTGMGSCMLLLYWGTAFSRHVSATIVINTAVAIVIAVGIYSAILHWIPNPVAGIVTALLPVIELVFLWRLTPIPYSIRHEVPIFSALPIKRSHFIVRFGVPVLIFGFALGSLRAVSMQVVLPASDITSQLLAWLAAGIAMVLTFCTIFIAGKDKHWDLLFRSLIPFIAVAVFALPFLNSGDSLFANLVLLVGFMCFEALMWIFFGELAQEFRISPIFIFGLGRGLLAFGSFFGSMMALYMPDFALFEAFGRAGGVIIILLVMVIAYVLLPRQREIKSLVSSNNQHLDHLDENSVSRLNAQAAAEASSYNHQSEPKEEEVGKVGRFRLQVETIADRYLLSRREVEVLFLLAKGYNAALIQEKLCISRSTAKTHISHIYRKLDIHTQQELLEMVEGVKDEWAEAADKGQALNKPSRA